MRGFKVVSAVVLVAEAYPMAARALLTLAAAEVSGEFCATRG